MININFFGSELKRNLLIKHFQVVYSSYGFTKNMKNLTWEISLGKLNSHKIFSSFSLNFWYKMFQPFKDIENVSFITYKSWVFHYSNWLIEYFTYSLQISKKYSVIEVLNNKHFLIIHDKSILYQYQSLIILSQSVSVNTKVLLVIWFF